MKPPRATVTPLDLTHKRNRAASARANAARQSLPLPREGHTDSGATHPPGQPGPSL